MKICFDPLNLKSLDLILRFFFKKMNNLVPSSNFPFALPKEFEKPYFEKSKLKQHIKGNKIIWITYLRDQNRFNPISNNKTEPNRRQSNKIVSFFKFHGLNPNFLKLQWSKIELNPNFKDQNYNFPYIYMC